MSSLGDNIRKFRIKKGLTQKQLADSCDMVDATIRTYELGKSNPKAKTVAKIAKALDVSTAELYGVDWIPGIESQNHEMDSDSYQSFLSGPDGTLFVNDSDKVRLLAAFDLLNQAGQVEAIKRIEEMTQLQAYMCLTPDGIIVGRKIRQIRKERGFTYQQLGELSDISVETLRRMELGSIPPEYLRQLSVALGVEVVDLLNLTPEEQKKIDDLRSAPQTLEEFYPDHSDDLYKKLSRNINDKMREIIDVALERLQTP